jgi:glycosyltransferase involved in cell wall biosynthesis
VDGSLVSIVIPAYNEVARLGTTLPALLDATDPDEIEIIVVDDGSSDDTFTVANELLGDRPRAITLRLEQNTGKGAAVRAGMLRASGDALVYMDADLATDLEDLKPLVVALDDAGVAIGSRVIEGSRVIGGTRMRATMARVWSSMVRALTGLPVRDTQCGFKAFRAPVARELFSSARVDRFAFDVEILALAQRRGMTIVEVPVTWSAKGGSRVRPFADSVNMMWDLVRLRWVWARDDRAKRKGSDR